MKAKTPPFWNPFWGVFDVLDLQKRVKKLQQDNRHLREINDTFVFQVEELQSENLDLKQEIFHLQLCLSALKRLKDSDRLDGGK